MKRRNFFKSLGVASILPLGFIYEDDIVNTKYYKNLRELFGLNHKEAIETAKGMKQLAEDLAEWSVKNNCENSKRYSDYINEILK